MIATAFRATGDPAIPGVVFACGVADSQTLDEGEYARERALLRGALDRASRIAQPLIYFSGAPIFGDFSDRITEASPCRPVTRYGRHQAECEDLIRASQAPFLIVRLPNVVGALGNPHQLIPCLVSQVRADRVTVQRSASRDLLDVEDVVRSVQRLIVLGATDQTINVASGLSTPVSVIVDHVVRILRAAPIICEHEGGEAHRFDVRRLATIIGPLPFDDLYPARTLVRYVPRIVASLAGRSVKSGSRPSSVR